MVGRRRSSNPSARAAAHGSWRARPGLVRLRASGLGLAVAVAVAAWPTRAGAEPPEDSPWGRGVTTLELDLSPSGLFNQDVTSLGFGLSARRYLLDGFSLGLGVADTIFVYRDAFRAQHPGIASQLPTNMLEITPLVQYVFFRSRWFSPFVYGGVGPVFFNHGGGTHGQWTGGPGVHIHVRGPIYATLGVAFSGLFPTGRCNDALAYRPAGSEAPGMPVDLCSFRWGPQLGFALAFGGRARQRRGPPRDEPRPVAPVVDSSTPAGATTDTNAGPPDATPAGSTDVADPPAPGNVAPPPGFLRTGLKFE
jgi:hypothetical protein